MLDLADVQSLSRRLLQPDQSPLWLYHGILFAEVLPRNESYG
jgi:hypothetical protein